MLCALSLSGCNISGAIKAAKDKTEHVQIELPGDAPSDPVTTQQEEEDAQGSVQTNAGQIEVIDINGERIETSVDVVEEAEAEDNASALPDVSLAQVAQNMSVEDVSNFAYSELNESAKKCYREILAVLTDMLSKVELTSLNPDEVDLAFRACMLDHPEIFYVKGYSIVKYMNGKRLDKIAFSGTYTMTPEEVKKGRADVEEYVNRVIAACPADAGDYEKIKYVYDYLITSNEYVKDSPDNQNILSVVRNGQTVCQGYTKVMQLLLNRMGVFCTLVNGTACGRTGVPSADELKNAKDAEWGGHVWNIVKCNGSYYNVDVTWGDSGITLLNNDGSLSRDVEVNYEFFLVKDDYLVGTHDPKPVVPMPVCNSMTDSYYMHEGLYFTDVDPGQFYRVFEKALSSGSSIVFIKASDTNVYDRIMNHLFEEQNVFDYMGRTNVRYVEFEERNLIMISL
ncbi:MAG: hypothetical protein K6F28_02980 [Lachnospiraceae bacterium]|nr:hypothetical protein [Lachnospiraceae bacterium]